MSQCLCCNRLMEVISERPSFSESDIFDQIVENNTVAEINEPPSSPDSSTSNIFSDGDEDVSEPTIIGYGIQTNRERMSIVCQ